jgi:hypothetical protein
VDLDPVAAVDDGDVPEGERLAGVVGESLHERRAGRRRRVPEAGEDEGRERRERRLHDTLARSSAIVSRAQRADAPAWASPSFSVR